MERIVILSLTGVIVALPVMVAAGCAFATSPTFPISRALSALWNLRALLSLGLASYWLLLTGDVGVISLPLWSDSALPELVMSLRVDRLAALFLASEALLSAWALQRFHRDAVSLNVQRHSPWIFCGALVSTVDVFVLSSNLLFTLICGILISRLCQVMCRGRVAGYAAIGACDQIKIDTAGSIFRWSEVALWVTLLLSCQFFGTGDYTELCDPLNQQHVASNNPAAIPVLAVCLVWITLTFARQFPFLFPNSIAIPDAGDRNFSLDRDGIDWSFDSLIRGFLVWPIGFWMLFRLAPVWHQEVVACQLLGLAGALTAVLAVSQAAVGVRRREIFSYASAAHLGLIAMLFSTGSHASMFAGLMLVGFDAFARSLAESQYVWGPPTIDGRQTNGIRHVIISVCVIMATCTFGGLALLHTELGRVEAVIESFEMTGLPADIFRQFPWIVVAVISMECWCLLRCMALPHKNMRNDHRHRFHDDVWMALVSLAAIVLAFFAIRYESLYGLLFPFVPVKEQPVDFSLFAIQVSGVALAAIAVGLLYGLNPEWRNSLRIPASPLLTLLRRGVYLPEVWKLLIYQPAEHFVELCGFFEEQVWPATGRVYRRGTSLIGESFLGGLEHGNIRMYGVAVLLTTAVMLGLLLYPEL